MGDSKVGDSAPAPGELVHINFYCCAKRVGDSGVGDSGAGDSGVGDSKSGDSGAGDSKWVIQNG